VNEAAPGSDGLRPRGPTRCHLNLDYHGAGQCRSTGWKLLACKQFRSLRTGEVDVFETASVLTNEFSLADVALAPAQFRALFDGALRASC
jgi:hypothetical protein